MITTLTPNPSLDRTVSLPGELIRGGVNRLAGVTIEPGGKGLNVARVLVGAGQTVTAVLPAASHDPLLRVLGAVAADGLRVRPVDVAGSARINTAVTEPDGTTTKLNESGAGLSEAEIAAIEGALSEELRLASDGRSWAVLSGSLPPGAPVDWYVRLVGLLRPLGVRIAVDTSDAPLAALAAGLPDCAPDLVKPNGEELAQLAGRGATDLEDAAVAGDFGPVAEAAQVLVGLGIGTVLATLGPAGGVLVTGEGAWHATAPSVPVVSTVGAGDSSIAGYILADVRGGGQAECLRTAMAYGSAAANLPGTTLPTPRDLPAQAAAITPLA